jgi:hypothetical protein
MIKHLISPFAVIIMIPFLILGYVFTLIEHGFYAGIKIACSHWGEE